MLERGENLKTNLSSSFRVSTVRASFSKSFYFFIVLAALYLFSNSVSARTGGGGLLSESGQAWTKEGRGLKTGKHVRTLFMDGPIQEHH